MTLINKIRERTGLMIGIIAAALGLFILSDLFSSGGLELFNPTKRIVGTIGGQEVSLEEFATEYERIRNNYALSTGSAPPENILPSIRQQAWDQLIFRVAFRKEFDKLGLQVTDAEIIDMVQGNNIHPGVAQSFTNPQTGEVDRAAIQNFLANLDKYDVSAQASWYNFERDLAPSRLREKYERMLSKTFYATSLQAKREYQSKNSKAELRYVFVPFSSIEDSTISVSDSELRDYFTKNRKDFEGEANRELEYLSFSSRPSAEDIQNLQKQLEALREPFAQTKNDTAFVEANSDRPNGITVVLPSNLPTELQYVEGLDGLYEGEVHGPYNAGTVFRMYKYVRKVQDSVPSARARHILFQAEGSEDDASVLKRANEVLRQIRAGASFEEMAREHGTDGTKERGGDLGWFTQGTMVEEFNDAVMNATAPGVLPQPVKTQFGYHLIEVTNTKTFDKYLIATIERDITPSDETIDRVYRQAGKYTQFKNRDELANNLDSGMILYQALNVPPTARSINNLTGNRVRQIVTWAYGDEAKVGDVSEIFDLDDQFIIAVLNKKREKGDITFEDVQEDVRTALLKKKKEEKIVNKLSELGGSLEEIQAAYGTGATIHPASGVSFDNPNITAVGFAPRVVGSAFSMKEGERSQPIVEANGVVLVELVSFDEAMEVADYSAYRRDVETRHNANASFKVNKALEKLYKVEENLHKYY